MTTVRKHITLFSLAVACLALPALGQPAENEAKPPKTIRVSARVGAQAAVIVTSGSTEITVAPGEKIVVTVVGVDAAGVAQPIAFTPKIEPDGVLTQSSDGLVPIALNNSNKPRNPPAPTATVSIPISGMDPINFGVRVREPLSKVELEFPASVQEGTEQPVNGLLTGSSGGSYTFNGQTLYSIDCVVSNTGQTSNVNARYDAASGKVVVGEINLPANEIQAFSEKKRLDCRVADFAGMLPPRDFTVYARTGWVAFSNPRPVVTLGGATELTAVVHSRDGAPDARKLVRWEIPDAEHQEIADLNVSANTAWLFVRRPPAGKAKPAYIKVRAVVTGGSMAAATYGDILVRVTEPAEFTKLRVRLDVMDDVTAGDLYGKQTAKEFHVAKVHLINNLQNDDTHEFVGASVLAFSDSIEVGVGLEKQWDKTSGSARMDTSTNKDDTWRPVTAGDLGVLLGPYSGVGGMDDERIVEACDTIYTIREPVIDDRTGRKSSVARTIVDSSGRLHYRPYTFEMIVNSVDIRDERTVRSRTFRALDLAGTFASFTAAAFGFGQGNDLVGITDKFSNLLVPSLQRIFPSLKETQRQNIVSQTMKPIEEIPYGTNISRVLFLPKTPFRGIGRGHRFRIATICPFEFEIDVAVLNKGDRSRENAARP